MFRTFQTKLNVSPISLLGAALFVASMYFLLLVPVSQAATAAPVFSPSSGSSVYTSPKSDLSSIKLSGPTGAKIYYTINGTTPTTNSYLYNSSVGVDLQPVVPGSDPVKYALLTTSYTIKAIAVLNGVSSTVTSASYTIRNSDQASRDDLRKYGIDVNKMDCWTKSKTTCTSLSGMLSTTLAEIKSFSKECDAYQPPVGPHALNSNLCGVWVTGGTEAGHTAGTYSHATGNKFDVSPVTLVNNHIAKPAYFTRLADVVVSGVIVKQYKRIATGKIYTNEKVPDHWDVLVK